MPSTFEFTHELVLPGPPLVAWYAVTTAQGLAGWHTPLGIDPSSPMVTCWEPNERFTMRIPMGPAGHQQLDYRISERPDGRVDFTFVHSGRMEWSSEELEMTRAAWDQYMFTLERFLTSHLERIPAYVEAEAPGHRVGPKAWRALREGLGLTPDATVGAEVRIERGDAEPIVGRVDYLTDRFVGVEAPNRLIRFHGRWTIGLPIAVADHIYLDPESPNCDVQAERDAWTRWLATD